MTAALYILGGPSINNREDFRYSLRSLTNAPDVTEVWAAGDIPTWFTGTRIPLVPQPEKFANQRASLTAFLNYPGAPDSFYLFNDDMFVTEPVVGQLPTCHMGRASTERKRLGTIRNSWARAVFQTAAWMEDQGHGDVLVYEAHTPLLFNTARLKALVNSYPSHMPLAVGEMYTQAGIGGEGTNCGNAKVRPGDDLAVKAAMPMPYLSGNDITWQGELGDMVRGLFTTASRWES